MKIVKVVKLSGCKDKIVFRNALGDEMTFLHNGQWWCWYPSEHKVTPKEQKKLDKAWRHYLKRKADNKLK